MHVLHVLEATLGGTRRAIETLLVALSTRGVRLTLLYADRRADPLFLERTLPLLGAHGVECRRFDMRRNPGPWDALAVVRMTRAIRSIEPDVVHLHASKPGLLGRSARLLSTRSRPLVYQPHGFAFLRRRRFLSTVYWNAERALAPFTDCCVLLSQAEVERADPLFRNAGVPAVTIPNIVSVEVTGAPGRLAEKRGWGAALLYVGRLAAEKHVEDLIVALAELRKAGRDVGLVLVGEGPERPRLEAAARHLEVDDRVHFAGFEREPYAMFQAADIVVHPSPFESFGLSVAEALLLGVPVVAVENAALLDLSQEGRLCRLVQPGDPGRLAEGIGHVLDHPEEARVIARRATEEVGRRFSAETVAATWVSLYETLMQRPGARAWS